MNYSLTAKGIQKAKERLDILKLSDKKRKAYRHYLDNLHYESSMLLSHFGQGLREGFEKGKEEGIEKGIEKGKKETAKQFLKQGVSVDIVAKATGIPKATLKKWDAETK